MPIPRHTVPSAPNRLHRAPPLRQQQLPCPACGHSLYVASRDFVDGRELHCAHCETRPILARDWDERTKRYHWILVDPESEIEDGHR